MDRNHALPLKSKRPQDWLPEERFTALQKSYSLTGENLNTWCREQGIFAHQLEEWKADFCSQGLVPEKREEARVLHTLKAEIHSLERELLPKDKASQEAHFNLLKLYMFFKPFLVLELVGNLAPQHACLSF